MLFGHSVTQEHMDLVRTQYRSLKLSPTWTSLDSLISMCVNCITLESRRWTLLG